MQARKANKRLFTVTTILLFAVVGAQSAHAAKRSVVSFRLTKWKAAHLDDAAKAKAHYDTLRRLGCEAKQGTHGGHYDVSYRSPKWRSVSLKTDDEAHQWAHWLAKNGFETLFSQPEGSGHLDTVAFRLPAWKSRHVNEASLAESHFDTLKMLGCEAKRGAHNGHFDVSYRCPQWRTIGLESHDDAAKWEKWLKANGFETVHEHNTGPGHQATARKP